MNPAPQFGIRLRALRKERDVTQVVVARTVGVRAAELAAWELGREWCPEAVLERLADFYGETLEDLAALQRGVEREVGLGAVVQVLRSDRRDAHRARLTAFRLEAERRRGVALALYAVASVQDCWAETGADPDLAEAEAALRRYGLRLLEAA